MKSALLLDDLPQSRDWLEKALQRAFPGIAMVSHDNLVDALAWIKQAAPPDLALIDLSLPDGSGVTLIEEINRRAPGTVCIVVTIFDNDLHLIPALRAGAQGYLLKDQSWQQIAQLLLGITEGRPPLSPAIARRLLAHFRPQPQQFIAPLTERETEVLALIAKGMTMAEAARLLGISPNTVAGYVKKIYRKLQVSSRAEAALTAHNLGLV